MITKIDRLPTVDVFETPYKYKQCRQGLIPEKYLSPEDYYNTDRIIRNSLEAALHQAWVGNDSSMERFIDDRLENNIGHQAWLERMPLVTPRSLLLYQSDYKNCDLLLVNREIEECGIYIPEGQFLFHGGLWSQEDSELATTRPLSTSFSPQMAMRNAEYENKALISGRLDILVLQVKSSNAKAFVYNMQSGLQGHEKEILFATGVRLKFLKEHFIKETTLFSESYRKYIGDQIVGMKYTKIYVLEMELY